MKERGTGGGEGRGKLTLPPKQQAVTFRAVGKSIWKSIDPFWEWRTTFEPPHLEVGCTKRL